MQNKINRIAILLSMLVLALAVVSPAAAARGNFPSVIPLPNGFQPEGIATGRGASFYVGSIPTGAIYIGDLRTGEGHILVPPQEGRAAIGLDLDKRSNVLWVAGGPTGQAYAYDGRTGATLAVYTLSASGNFINDQIVAQDAVYFTNSNQAVFYRIPLGPGGKVIPGAEVEAISLSGDWQQVSGFNANGIEATPDGEHLIIVNSTVGAVYLVDPQTGVADEIDLAGGDVAFGDGLLLDGHTLYVVQNQLNRIAVVQLSPDYSTGEITGYITDPDFRVPTTLAEKGPFLYAVNARFGTPPTPDTEYEVVQVLKQR